MQKAKLSLYIALCLIGFGVLLRILPHPANFAPVAAIAIFAGAVLPRKHAIWVPLATMIVSDAFIGFHDLVWATWGCYALVALASSHWMKKATITRGAVLTLGSSVFFFAVTNLAVWSTSGMYAHTWAGLTKCFYMALPFFRNTILSDIIYTSVLFGAYALAVWLGSTVLSRNNSAKLST